MPKGFTAKRNAWSLEFGFGLNYPDGFFLDIGSGDELQGDVDVSVPGGGITGTLQHFGVAHLLRRRSVEFIG